MQIDSGTECVSHQSLFSWLVSPNQSANFGSFPSFRNAQKSRPPSSVKTTRDDTNRPARPTVDAFMTGSRIGDGRVSA